MTTFQRPYALNPWSKGAGTKQNGGVWISMKPRKILDQFSKGAGDIATGEVEDIFIFLAPLSLNENIVHNWEAYESVASRLAQKVRSAVKLGAEGSALTNVFENSANISDQFKGLFNKKGGQVGQTVESFVSDVYKSVPASRIPNIKIDTPLYYSNSNRRQLVLDFQLYHEKMSSKPEDSLIKPIKQIMKYSSPDFKGGLNIEFPYMWEVKTLPSEFIKYTTCALTAVQPTWNQPYYNGVPSSCNLQLTFTDMSPLYRETITEGSIINIITKEEADSRKASSQLTKASQKIKILSANKDVKPSNKIP